MLEKFEFPGFFFMGRKTNIENACDAFHAFLEKASVIEDVIDKIARFSHVRNSENYRELLDFMDELAIAEIFQQEAPVKISGIVLFLNPHHQLTLLRDFFQLDNGCLHIKNFNDFTTFIQKYGLYKLLQSSEHGVLSGYLTSAHFEQWRSNAKPEVEPYGPTPR